MDLKYKSNTLNFTEDGFIIYDYLKVDQSKDFTYSWEIIDWKSVAIFCNRNWYFPLIISAVYIFVIFSIQSFMKHRKPFHLKRELFIWNAALGLFSFVAFVRFIPPFLEILLQPDGYYKSMCIRPSVLGMPVAFYSVMFVVTKVIELGDTFFIVLRKKPLQLLQWYHHAVSLTLAWNSLPYLEVVFFYYGIMNYGIHSLMYPYFAIRALDIKVPKRIANSITFLQLAQMAFGVYLNFYTGYLYYYKGNCDRDPYTIKIITFAYGSFLILFGELFYRLVLKSPKKKVE